MPLVTSHSRSEDTAKSPHDSRVSFTARLDNSDCSERGSFDEVLVGHAAAVSARHERFSTHGYAVVSGPHHIAGPAARAGVLVRWLKESRCRCRLTLLGCLTSRLPPRRSSANGPPFSATTRSPGPCSRSILRT